MSYNFIKNIYIKYVKPQINNEKSNHEYTEAATQKCSLKTLFSNYATNLQGNTHVEV